MLPDEQRLCGIENGISTKDSTYSLFRVLNLGYVVAIEELLSKFLESELLLIGQEVQELSVIYLL